MSVPIHPPRAPPQRIPGGNALEPSKPRRKKFDVTIAEVFAIYKPALNWFDKIQPRNPALISLFAKNSLAAQRLLDDFAKEDKRILARFGLENTPPNERSLEGAMAAAKAASDELEAAVADDEQQRALSRRDAAEDFLQRVAAYEQAMRAPIQEHKHAMRLYVFLEAELLPFQGIPPSVIASLFQHGIIIPLVDDDDDDNRGDETAPAARDGGEQ